MKRGQGWYIEEYESPTCFEIRDTDGSIIASNYARDYEHESEYRLMLAQARRLIRLLEKAESGSDAQLSAEATAVQMPKRMLAEIQ